MVRKLVELGYERALRQSYLGSSVRLSEEQLGDVWRTDEKKLRAVDRTKWVPLALVVSVGSKKGRDSGWQTPGSAKKRLRDECPKEGWEFWGAAAIKSPYTVLRANTPAQEPLEDGVFAAAFFYPVP